MAGSCVRGIAKRAAPAPCAAGRSTRRVLRPVGRALAGKVLAPRRALRRRVVDGRSGVQRANGRLRAASEPGQQGPGWWAGRPRPGTARRRIKVQGCPEGRAARGRPATWDGQPNVRVERSTRRAAEGLPEQTSYRVLRAFRGRSRHATQMLALRQGDPSRSAHGPGHGCLAPALGI